MGNYASCALGGGAGRNSGSGGGAVKVLIPGGQIRNFHEPVKAAELMLETPNSFLVNSKSFHIGSRFAALSADEDLEIGEVYVLFPMRRLNFVVAAADMATLFMAAKKKASGSAKGRVSPEAEDAPVRVKLKEMCSPELMQRRSMCRSRRPALDTIVEESVGGNLVVRATWNSLA